MPVDNAVQPNPSVEINQKFKAVCLSEKKKVCPYARYNLTLVKCTKPIILATEVLDDGLPHSYTHGVAKVHHVMHRFRLSPLAQVVRLLTLDSSNTEPVKAGVVTRPFSRL